MVGADSQPLPVRDPNTGRKCAVQRLHEALSRLCAVAGPLSLAGVLNPEQANSWKVVNKMAAPGKVRSYGAQRLRIVTTELTSLADSFERLYEEAVEDGRIGQVASANESTLGSTEISTHGNETGALGGTPGEPEGREADLRGEKTHTREIPFRAAVGRIKPCVAEDRAILRAVIITPVLNGTMNAEQCAGAWKEVAAGRADAKLRLQLGDIPHSVRPSELRVSARTIRRWVAEVHSARANAERLGEPVPPLHQILKHKSSTRTRARSKATPAIITMAERLFTGLDPVTGESLPENRANLTMAGVARYLTDVLGYDVSTRTVQRVLNLTVPDYTRGIKRGGPAAEDVMFRLRILREAPRPNHTWIIDHTWIRQDCKGTTGTEWALDLGLDIRPSRKGRRQRRRKGLYLSMIMDAFSRRILAIRLWTTAPTAPMVMALLFHTAERYGLPKILYSDNGPDFRSKDVHWACHKAGIKQIFSTPYSPEGRGKIERAFRTLKEMIMPFIRGYRAPNATQTLAEEDLLTRAEAEKRIWDLIEVFMNGEVHSSTGHKPTELYDNAVGALQLRGNVQDGDSVTPHLHLLPVKHGVQKRSIGFRYANHFYSTPRLRSVPNGAKLCIHIDPFDLRQMHVSVPDDRGVLRYLGVAKRQRSAAESAAAGPLARHAHADREAAASIAAQKEEARIKAEAQEGAAQLVAGIKREIAVASAVPELPPALRSNQRLLSAGTPTPHTSLSPGASDSTRESGKRPFENPLR